MDADLRRIFAKRPPKELVDIPDYRDYCDRLFAYREDRRLSRRALAEEIGINYSTLKKVENRESQMCFQSYLAIGEKTGIWGSLGRNAKREPKPRREITMRTALTDYRWPEIEEALNQTGPVWNVKQASELLSMPPSTVWLAVKRNAPEHPRRSRGRPRPEKGLTKQTDV